MVKWTKEKVEELINSVDSSFSLYEYDYKGVDKPLKLIHTCGHIKEISITHIKERGLKCSHCLDINRWTTETYQQRLDKLYNGEYSIVEEYKDSRTSTKHKHNVCGNIIEVTPDNLLRGRSSCMYCNNKVYWNTDTFKKKVEELDSEYECLSDYVNNSTYVNMRHKTCGFIYKVQPKNFLSGKRCPYCTKSNYVSRYELEIKDFISSLGVRTISSYVGKCQLQLDIYCPDLKIGFEINGAYWHNSKFIPKYRHRNKVTRYLDEGIRVYNIWDYWGEDKIKSIVLSKLGKTDRVYARKCDIVEIDSKISKEFFDRTHVDNYTQSIKTFALIKDNEIQCALAIRSNKEGIEIARFANKLNTTVVGGYARLLRCVIDYCRDNSILKIISYCDRDLSPDSNGSVYKKLGFTFIKDCGPILKFYNMNNHEVYSRQKYQKFKNKGLPGYDESISNKEILEYNNIYEIWNSGNYKYVLYL